MIGSVSHPKGGSAFCAFFNLRCNSADWEGHCDTATETGWLNSRVALRGSSVRENPLEEKSCQESVARFAARA